MCRAGGAAQSTSVHAAYEALKDFVKELEGTTGGALRGKNGLLAKLATSTCSLNFI